MAVQNRKRFFEDYAKQQGFDPSISENWKKITYGNICSVKVLILLWLLLIILILLLVFINGVMLLYSMAVQY